MNKRIVFASNNPKKLEEIRSITEGKIEIRSLNDIGCFDELPETQETIEGNALQKARYVAEHFNIACFADDTGLEVTALGGRPGVYSARYSGPDCSADDNMEKLLEEMQGEQDRSACFRTVIAWVSGKEEHCFEGKVEGEILTAKHGEKGFGYDPVFRPIGYEKSFAQMSSEEKNAISHRRRAIDAFTKFLLK